MKKWREPNNQYQVQSVIQANQSSVIQTAANLQPLLGKGVLYVNKGNSVIHTAPGKLRHFIVFIFAVAKTLIFWVINGNLTVFLSVGGIQVQVCIKAF